MRLLLRTGIVAVAVVLFAACSESPSSVDEHGKSAKVSDTISTTTTIPDVYDVVHQPAMGEFVGALADVSDHVCEQTAGGWRVTGTAINPTTGSVDYRVYISLLNSTLATRAVVEEEVFGIAPSSMGSFERVIAMPEADLRCVLRVERRSPGS